MFTMTMVLMGDGKGLLKCFHFRMGKKCSKLNVAFLNTSHNLSCAIVLLSIYGVKHYSQSFPVKTSLTLHHIRIFLMFLIIIPQHEIQTYALILI